MVLNKKKKKVESRRYKHRGKRKHKPKKKHHDESDEEDESENEVDNLDDYLIVRKIEQIYLHLEKIESKLQTDRDLCPNYNAVQHTESPLIPNMGAAGMTARVYELMMCEDSSRLAFAYYVLTILLILISLVSLVFQEEYDRPFWDDMELFITVFFTLEYVVTLAIVNNKLTFLISASVFDILAVLPWYIERFPGAQGSDWILLVRLLRIARMNRIRQSPNPYVFLIGKTLGGVSSILSGIFLWLAIGSLIIGTCVRVLEPETFYSIPLGMWFGLVTLTTVGYGDISPSSTDGYIIGSIAIIFGLCLCSIVLQAVGQIYNDNIEILKDQMMEIKQALFDRMLLIVKNGDDLHFHDGVTFKDMIDCCMDDSKCYPKINELLREAREMSGQDPNFIYLKPEVHESLLGPDDWLKYQAKEMKTMKKTPAIRTGGDKGDPDASKRRPDASEKGGTEFIDD